MHAVQGSKKWKSTCTSDKNLTMAKNLMDYISALAISFSRTHIYRSFS